MTSTAVTSIYLFNTSPASVQITIRSATTPVSIPGTSGMLLWTPNSPSTEPAWGGTSPAPGQFGFGSNAVMITNGQNLGSVNMAVVIPNILPTTSLQIYLFYSPPTTDGQQATAYWVGLNDGFPFAGQIGTAIS